MTSMQLASFDTPPQSPPRGTRPVGSDGVPLFASDAGGEDWLGRGEAGRLLAEALVHGRVETPLALAVFGPAGSGRSSFVRHVLDHGTRLSAAAGAQNPPGPFLPRVVAARVDAASAGDPAAALVGALIAALGPDHASFAEDAIYAGSDPREGARLAGERVTGLRRTLDDERRRLDDLGARRAKLADTVLFDAAGSRVDTYARTNRGRIEARLRAFDLAGNDPVVSYKELVREAADSNSAGSRLGLTLRSLWAFKGQGSLLVLAVVLLVAGWAASAGSANQGSVGSWLASFGDRFAALTDWARAHLDLLQPISQIAWALAALVLLLVIVRALRFLGPIFRGATLLRGELEGRRRELDGQLAHQTRRVDQLAAEADSAGKAAEAAERRVEGRQAAGISEHGAALAADLFGAGRSTDDAARAFFAKLSGAMVAPEGSAKRPQRIVVAIDGLDRLPGPAAAAFLETAHRLLGRPGFAMVLPLDRHHVLAALGETDPALAATRLDRMVQISFDLGAAPTDTARLAELLLDPRIAETQAPSVDATRSVLDRSMQPFEAGLAKALAPFTGSTPRGVKRFVNAYRVARADPRMSQATPAAFGTLAWALALDGTSSGSELTAFEAEIAKGQVTMDQTSDIGRSFSAMLSAVGQDISVMDARRGLAVARSFSRIG